MYFQEPIEKMLLLEKKEEPKDTKSLFIIIMYVFFY